MAPEEVLELTRLVERAEQALARTGLVAVGDLSERLRGLVREVTGRPVGRALGLFVNSRVHRSIVLPVDVTSRVLVEPSFATRDLLRALHRTPPHLLVMLYPGVAAVFQAQGDHLSAVGEVLLSVDATAHPDDGASATSAATKSMLEELDAVLGSQRRDFTSPLVVAGTPALVDQFCRLSRHLARLAGRITDAETPEQLQQQAARALESYLRSRGHEALELVALTATGSPELLVSGLDECWAAAQQTRPAVLAVEQGYAAPGHYFGGLDSADDTGDPVWQHDLEDDPFYVHDLVDDLIEAVIKRGGWVAFVEDGELVEHGRVALVTIG